MKNLINPKYFAFSHQITLFYEALMPSAFCDTLVWGMCTVYCSLLYHDFLLLRTIAKVSLSYFERNFWGGELLMWDFAITLPFA